MNQQVNKNMFSFEKFFALCNEAANFSKFTYKLSDREEYLKNPSVVTALTKLSSSGGLKIFSLPYVFSFEGELNARGFKISDIYAVEKNSSKLKHLVMPTASGVKESSKGINIWFPISKSSATDIPYKAAEIDELLINNGSETMGKYGGPMTRPTDITLIKDLDINIIDLDYTGPVSNAHYEAIQAGHDLLQDHGLLFVTFQASHFRRLSSEMRAQFDNYSKAYASDEYKSLIPSAAEARGFGVKERESYEKYASNITKEIAERVKGLKPIYINPYLGGEGTSKSSTMIRLIFVKDASNTFAINSSIEIPQALEELKFMPLTSSRLDIHDLATMLESDKNLLYNFCNLFKTVYDEAKNQTGEPDKSKLNAAKKAHVTSAIVKNAIRDFDDGNELYAQILYHNLGGGNVGYFINDDPRILLESLDIICKKLLSIYSQKVTSEEAFLKLYDTVDGKITDIEKYKNRLEQRRQDLAAEKGKTHAPARVSRPKKAGVLRPNRTSIVPTQINDLIKAIKELKPGDEPIDVTQYKTQFGTDILQNSFRAYAGSAKIKMPYYNVVYDPETNIVKYISRKNTNLDTSIAPTTINFLAYSKPGDYLYFVVGKSSLNMSSFGASISLARQRTGVKDIYPNMFNLETNSNGSIVKITRNDNTVKGKKLVTLDPEKSKNLLDFLINSKVGDVYDDIHISGASVTQLISRTKAKNPDLNIDLSMFKQEFDTNGNLIKVTKISNEPIAAKKTRGTQVAAENIASIHFAGFESLYKTLLMEL